MSDSSLTLPANARQDFLADVLAGLSAAPKRLSSKWFYDAAGDRIFQQIMDAPEYYLTRCEREILEQHSGEIAQALLDGRQALDVVELGAGDGSKTVVLLRALLEADAGIRYRPVDISANALDSVAARLHDVLPTLDVAGIHAEFLAGLRQASQQSDGPKAILFMGANIGNMLPEEAIAFCRAIHANCAAGDALLMGFDLKKNPRTILAAYNDAAGFTRAFNLNLLYRINRELGGDFDVDAFSHFPTYDPATGACKSYLVSERGQDVRIAGRAFHFEKGEPIHTEISQKYSRAEIAAMGAAAGFAPAAEWWDADGAFMVTLWRA